MYSMLKPTNCSIRLSRAPLICLVDVSAGDNKAIVVVDRLAYVNTFNLRAKDAASLKEAIKRLTADGSIRIGNNNSMEA
jgi:hypothetical protein